MFVYSVLTSVSLNGMLSIHLFWENMGKKPVKSRKYGYSQVFKSR